MSLQKTTLYLSKGGESFLPPVMVTGDASLASSFLKDVDFETDNAHPKLKEIQSCKTHRAVLSFLKDVEHDPTFLNHVSLYHIHHPHYAGHNLNLGFGIQKGSAHPDTIQEMISFVEKRIQHKNSPHAAFDKIGRGLGHTFRFLSKASAIPIIGMIPAAIKILIGGVQIIAGAVLSIFSAIPAYFSENAHILLQRSSRHIGHGVCNIIRGVIEGIPLLGTWIYFTRT